MSTEYLGHSYFRIYHLYDIPIAEQLCIDLVQKMKGQNLVYFPNLVIYSCIFSGTWLYNNLKITLYEMHGGKRAFFWLSQAEVEKDLRRF